MVSVGKERIGKQKTSEQKIGEQKRAPFSMADETASSAASSAVEWVLSAITQPKARRRLLQQRSHLDTILKSIPARRALYERATLAETAEDRRAALSLIVDIMKASRKIWRGGAISVQN